MPKQKPKSTRKFRLSNTAIDALRESEPCAMCGTVAGYYCWRCGRRVCEACSSEYGPRNNSVRRLCSECKAAELSNGN